MKKFKVTKSNYLRFELWKGEYSILIGLNSFNGIAEIEFTNRYGLYMLGTPCKKIFKGDERTAYEKLFKLYALALKKGYQKEYISYFNGSYFKIYDFSSGWEIKTKYEYTKSTSKYYHNKGGEEI